MTASRHVTTPSDIDAGRRERRINVLHVHFVLRTEDRRIVQLDHLKRTHHRDRRRQVRELKELVADADPSLAVEGKLLRDCAELASHDIERRIKKRLW